jgi:hypothetical protein
VNIGTYANARPRQGSRYWRAARAEQKPRGHPRFTRPVLIAGLTQRVRIPRPVQNASHFVSWVRIYATSIPMLLLVFALLSVTAQGCPHRRVRPPRTVPRPRNTLGRKLFSDGLRAPALAVQLDYSHDDHGWYPTWTAELHPGACYYDR